MSQWVTAKVIKNQKWTTRLFRLILHAPISPFIAGQFTKIALPDKNNKYIKRVYSYVNAPDNKNLEFCIALIKSGIMSNKLYLLKPGDTILITKSSSGFFTISEIPKCKTLWMFATGTAIGPFCSILQDKLEYKKFQKIILIYAVKFTKELVYLPLIRKIQKKYHENLYVQTITSQELHTNSLYGRIPTLIKNGYIESTVNEIIHPNQSHIMLCGNPDMVKDTKSVLMKYRALRKHLRRIPGHITSENYW